MRIISDKSSKIIVAEEHLAGKENLGKEVLEMAVHHGGKVGKAGKTLASNSTSKSAKSKAGKTLANHKAKCHSK